MPGLRSNGPRVRSGHAKTRHWVFGVHAGRSSRIALRWDETPQAELPAQGNIALSTGRRCRRTNTYVLDVTLAGVRGYIDGRTGRVALLLYLMQCILEVGSTVHHAGSGKKGSQKTGGVRTWEELLVRQDGSSQFAQNRCLLCITHCKLSNRGSDHSRSPLVECTLQEEKH